MNSKAIKRQLLAAVAMVLVAAIALGSSTYAWFVASGSVTATGMSVNATSEGGLVISYGTNAWGITASAAEDTTNVPLTPVSTADLANWYHATAKESANYAADDTTRTDVTDKVMDGGSFRANKDTDNKYVVARTFNIRSSGNADAGTLAKGLYVSNITVTGASQQMHTALRVGIICNYKNEAEAGPFIYGPVTVTGGNGDTQNSAKTPYDVFGAWNGTTAAKVGTVNLKTAAEANQDEPLLKNTVTIPNSTNTNDYVKVTVLIWFEGEDWNLTSDKYDASTLDVTVEFTSLGLSGETV